MNRRLNATVFRKRTTTVGLLGGAALFAALLAVPAPAGLDPAAWRTAAVGLLMAVWWMSEAVPIAVTSLLPMVLFPLLGVASMADAAAPYANPLVFLFLGGFLIALAIERWGLHRRIALSIIARVGTRPHRIVAGFMIASALLSMWISNTATTMMMLPIALSVVELAVRRAPSDASRAVSPASGGVAPPRRSAATPASERLARNARSSPGTHPSSTDGPPRPEDAEREGPFHSPLAICLMLGVAYAASIGGMGTLIGSPPNALLAGFLAETTGEPISFLAWLSVGLPVAVVGLGITFLLLTRWIFPLRLERLPGGADLVRRELEGLGPMSRGERTVAVVFVATALSWVARPLLAKVVPGLTDTGIALAGAVLLFVVPVDWRGGQVVLEWTAARRLPWGVLLLFGGGFSLAGAVGATGLAAWIGAGLQGASAWPAWLVTLAVVTVIVFLTELTSNTATAATFLPVVASIAVALGRAPMLLLVPATLAASCAFMMPVATPPNAIVYGSGHVTVPQMVHAGIWLNLLFTILLTAAAFVLVPWIASPP